MSVIEIKHERCRWTSQRGVEFAEIDPKGKVYDTHPAREGWTDIRWFEVDLQQYEMDLVVQPNKTVPQIAAAVGAEVALNGPFAYITPTNATPLGYRVRDGVLDQRETSVPQWIDFILDKSGTPRIAQLDPANVDDIALAFSATSELVRDGQSYVNVYGEDTPADVRAGDRPRTALGIKADGNLLFVVVDGDAGSDAGMTLPELARVMLALGAEAAMNLDGGGSSCLVHTGEEISGNPGDRRLGAAICFKRKGVEPPKPGELVKVDMISGEHATNPMMDPVGLTVHTTANRNKGATAIMHDRYYDNNSDRVSVHWTVDAIHAVQSLPEDKAAWHAGNSDYNRSYIGMEICENNVVDGKLDAATYRNAVLLAADILHRHGWGKDEMIQHREVPGREWKNCPNKELIDWPVFVADVLARVAAMKGEPAEPKVLWRVQVGAFGQKANAEALAAELESKGYQTIIKEELK